MYLASHPFIGNLIVAELYYCHGYKKAPVIAKCAIIAATPRNPSLWPGWDTEYINGFSIFISLAEAMCRAQVTPHVVRCGLSNPRENFMN